METKHAPEGVELDIEALRAQAEQNCQLMASAYFLGAWQDVVAHPDSERGARGRERLTPAALRKGGIDVPEGLRISSRYFEKSFEARDEAGLAALAVALPGVLPVDLLPDVADDTGDSHDILGQEAGAGPTLASCFGFGAASICACWGRIVPPA